MELFEQPEKTQQAIRRCTSEDGLKRVITGVVLIPIIVYIVLYTSVYWVLGISTVLTFLALREFGGLSPVKERNRVFEWVWALLGASFPLVLYFYGPDVLLPLFIPVVFILFAFSMAGRMELREASLDLSHKALGLVYLALPLSFLGLMPVLDGGKWWLLFMLVVVWANDTCAYFTGKFLGKHKLSPEISPKKTLEGAAGGILGGAVAAVLFGYFADLGHEAWKIFVLSLLVGVVAMIGDLAESFYKRSAGVKDSGSIFPGHGGVLDRIDSLVFVIPLVFFYLVLHNFKIL